MNNRFKCTRCSKIFYLVDRPELADKESRKAVLCTPCFKGLLRVNSYQEQQEYLNDKE